MMYISNYIHLLSVLVDVRDLLLTIDKIIA